MTITTTVERPKRPSPLTGQSCRLCHQPIVPTSQYYRATQGTLRLGSCICHDYIFDHAIKRWSIIEGNRKIQKRGKKQRTVSANGAQGAPRFNEYRLLDDRVIYCINCRVRMIYHKEFAHSTGWIASFRCPNCTREQHYH